MKRTIFDKRSTAQTQSNKLSAQKIVSFAKVDFTMVRICENAGEGECGFLTDIEVILVENVSLKKYRISVKVCFQNKFSKQEMLQSFCNNF